jgi:hypothetical protein
MKKTRKLHASELQRDKVKMTWRLKLQSALLRHKTGILYSVIVEKKRDTFDCGEDLDLEEVLIEMIGIARFK